MQLTDHHTTSASQAGHPLGTCGHRKPKLFVKANVSRHFINRRESSPNAKNVNDY
ncbi:hypothetical protein RSSM_05625 [Rhodopirellula sallentina SM41]|uniref:Uncharacterized protein n=1 Tax=Rhodopirellula sallentina SM41 TaxID=1263870 RepID=M5UA53_9BACT|nr:hypothetical protein RSSM_05625 [Rhodopirellula sallentina SM41]